jgi:pimeloyl-ACP methyl ester carboxylesterase
MSHRQRRRTTAALVAGLALLTGCSGHSSPAASSPTASPSVTAGSPGPSTSASTGVPAALRRFYDQQLRWTSCDSGFQCSTLTVPVSYSAPTGKTLGIAVIRKRSTGSHQRSLIVNPGGPGASGVDFVSGAASAFGQLTEHDDLVSFDPRGVGRSRPIRCLSSAQLDADIGTDPVPATASQLAALVAESKLIASNCYRRNGSYLDHVGTIDEARDMDVLRAALGDAKLTYYGASYGTYLGAKYAQLFPTRIRAMVLDGALDPAESGTASNQVQAEGFETDLHDFLASCVGTHACPLGDSTSNAEAGLHQLEARVTSQPEAVGSRRLGAGEFFEGLASGLYSPDDWPSLRIALSEAKNGNGSGMLLFSDNLTERHPDGSYSNLVESNIAINCIDRPWPRSLSSYQASAKAFAKTAPDFGAAIEYGSLPCAYWKVPPVETNHPVAAPGAPPILVIGTTRDPATPYVWAQSLAKQLSSGVLLTFDGDGHTAYLRGDSCVDSAVNAYVTSLRLPKAGTRCA